MSYANAWAQAEEEIRDIKTAVWRAIVKLDKLKVKHPELEQEIVSIIKEIN